MTRRKTALLSSLLSICLTGAAPAQAPADAPRPADLDYTGSVQLMPETGELVAGWTIRIMEPELDAITFGLSAALGPAVITGAHVGEISKTLDPRFDGAVRTYKVALTPASDFSPRLIRLAYAGPLFDGDPPFPINTLNSNKVELTVDSFWFPFDMRFGSALTANLGVRIDGEWSGVGVGTIDRVDQGFRVAQTKPALDIAFSLLSNSQLVTSDRYVIHDARTEPGTKIEDLTRILEICTAYLNDLAGPAGPLPQASIIVTDRAEGGYSRGTLIALTDIESESEIDLQKFICHELSHYWSYANAGGPENWINEGVADYIALMGVRHAVGEAAYESYLSDYSDRIKRRGLPPIWTPESEGRPPYLNSYRAAPLALSDLEARMGRPAFKQLIQTMMLERTATTPDLLALIGRIDSVETRDWFKARLAQPGS